MSYLDTVDSIKVWIDAKCCDATKIENIRRIIEEKELNDLIEEQKAELRSDAIAEALR